MCHVPRRRPAHTEKRPSAGCGRGPSKRQSRRDDLHGPANNDSPSRAARCGPVHTEFNECVDVQSEHSHDKINGSVFADVRQATGWFLPRGNVIRNCRNSVGHVDCNALYGKSYDILVENNLFEDNGANAVDGKAGSEGAQITFKGGDPERQQLRPDDDPPQPVPLRARSTPSARS